MTVAGVIGFGSAGRRHASLLAERGCEILISEPDTASADAATEAGYATVAENELLGRAHLIVIASPNHLHAAQFEAAVDAGRDVLVEKPLAVVPTPELAAALARAKASGLVVGIGCNLRFVPAIEACREQVAAGTLGRVLRASADFGYDLRRWRPGRDWRDVYSARAEQGGGILLDAIHEFDYLYWLFGEVARVACFADARSSLDMEVEDVAGALLEFESGVLGSIALDYASPVYRRGFEVVGEVGTLTWRWPGPSLLLEHEGGTAEIPVDGVETMYPHLIDDFLAAVADRRAPRTPGEDGLAVLRIVDAARRFAFGKAGEAVVP